MITFQDFAKAQEAGLMPDYILTAINHHMGGEEYKLAVIADDYDKQQNTTINAFYRKIYTAAGVSAVDYTSANNKIASNFFHRLITQRDAYSLGNGIISFSDPEDKKKGKSKYSDKIKKALGTHFDTDLYNTAYAALKHGASFGFWNYDRLYVYPLTQFVPMYDENSGALRAGIRFWSLEWGRRPMNAVLYEEDGYTVYRSRKDGEGKSTLTEIQAKRPYKLNTIATPADGVEVIGGENYGSLPIVPLWANKGKQSAIVGLRSAIDSYDLIQSGFANDLQDCAQAYWIINNAMGMDSSDIQKFIDRIKFQHAAVADMDNSEIKPYTQEIPYNARVAFLNSIRSQIYEAFGAVDVHTVSAGSTNDHIMMAYQAQDEEADDFEYQIIEFVQQVLKIAGLPDAVPQFKRNRVANEYQQTQMIMLAAERLDDRAVLELLPFVPVDKIDGILQARGVKENSRFVDEESEETSDENAV